MSWLLLFVVGELLLLLSNIKLFISFSSFGEVGCGEGGTTTHRVVTFTLPLDRCFMSHKSVSFFFIVSTFNVVDGNVESFDLLDCILIDFTNHFAN